MRVPVVVQDHAVWLPPGWPQLLVLLVSGAVRQRCAPDLTGQAVMAQLAEATPRGLARQLEPAFAAGVAGKTRRLFWFRGGNRRRCPLLLPPLRPLYLHRDGVCIDYLGTETKKISVLRLGCTLKKTHENKDYEK